MSSKKSPRLGPVKAQSLNRLHPQALRSVFWELGEAAENLSVDAVFEKEAWLHRVLIDFGPCGFTIDFPHNLRSHVRASILYCAPVHAPGAQQMPTAPVSRDAALITSLHIDPALRGRGLESVLLDSTIIELTHRGERAIEAFGLVNGSKEHPIVGLADEIGLMSLEHLQAAGFEIVSEHPELPRLRLELPPRHDLLHAEEIEQLLSGAALAPSRC